MAEGDKYPDQELSGRGKLAYDWVGEDVINLFDGGCSYGYTTQYYAKKSKNTYASDLNSIHIEIAKKKYSNIEFKVESVEQTSFDNKFFDEIIITDVLEHTSDRIKTLSEMCRILKPGGGITISTPHKGLFTFLDPYNYGYYLKRYIPFVYKSLYKSVRFVKEGKFPNEFNPEHNQKHYHYSLDDYIGMLNRSEFNNNYKIEKVFKSGLLIEVLVMNLEAFLNILNNKRVTHAIIKPLQSLAERDFWIEYGVFSYNIAVRVKKLD